MKLIRLTLCYSILVLLEGCSSPLFTPLESRYSDTELKNFGLFVCMSASFRADGQNRWAEELDFQAWQFAKSASWPAYIMMSVFRQSVYVGERVHPDKAASMCGRWRDSQTLRDLMSESA